MRLTLSRSACGLFALPLLIGMTACGVDGPKPGDAEPPAPTLAVIHSAWFAVGEVKVTLKYKGPPDVTGATVSIKENATDITIGVWIDPPKQGRYLTSAVDYLIPLELSRPLGDRKLFLPDQTAIRHASPLEKPDEMTLLEPRKIKRE
ncbi:hypothetical protein [Actinocorallia longicatena]|uniref:Lipoprotein n=1 Tax=Actinocorallia longicatena TaxID=111803 RepID=A0ABP6QMY8_9ACTN